MYLADAALLEVNATFWIELVAFLLMLGLLARFAYPRIIAAAEARQDAITAELEAAEKSRRDAESRLVEAKAQLDEARAGAQEILEGARRSGDQLRAELSEKAEEEAKRLTERARQEIIAERQKAIESVRGEVADLVVAATEKVVGESLDGERHRKLIDQAIKAVGKGGERGR